MAGLLRHKGENLLEQFWLPVLATVAGGIILLIIEYRTKWFSQRHSPDRRKTMTKRKRIPKQTQTQLLTLCRRRCCLCFGLDRDLTQKRGQIAHLDQNPANDRLDNLAYLCIPHHDQYDSRTRQSKGLTIDEVKTYRAQLYDALASAAPQPEKAPAPAEISRIAQIGNPIIRLLRGVRASRIFQLGSGRIEVTDQTRPTEEE